MKCHNLRSDPPHFDIFGLVFHGLKGVSPGQKALLYGSQKRESIRSTVTNEKEIRKSQLMIVWIHEKDKNSTFH